MNILEKYLNDFELELIKDNYAEDYLESVCSSNYAENNIKLLLNYKLYFVGNILYYYMSILEIPTNVLEKRLKLFINIIGDDYVNIIDQNIELLEPITTGV